MNPSTTPSAKLIHLSLLPLLALSFVARPASAELTPDKEKEVISAIRNGLAFLEDAQNKEGYWSSAEYPGLTGLVVQSFLLAPKEAKPASAPVRKGLEFIRSNAKPDGGIYNRGLSNYNTSIALTTLLHANEKSDETLIKAARNFLVGGQNDGKDDARNEGGFGYEPTGERSRPDLDNTVFAMEALDLFRKSGIETPGAEDLDWDAAVEFVSRCQHLKGNNDADWVSDSEQDKGGFVYTPHRDKDGTHSYGTMTYSGLLSLVHAEVDANDKRVVAAVDWLSRHFTVEENPGKGEQGLYYYYFVMSKALTAAGLEELPTKSGDSVDWDNQLADKLLSIQKDNGSWMNENGRWMEKDPVLVTAYVTLALSKMVKGL